MVNLATPVATELLRLSEPAFTVTPAVLNKISRPDVSMRLSRPISRLALIVTSFAPIDVTYTDSAVARLVVTVISVLTSMSAAPARKIAPLAPAATVVNEIGEPVALLSTSGLAAAPIAPPRAISVMPVAPLVVELISVVAVPLVMPPEASIVRLPAVRLPAPNATLPPPLVLSVAAAPAVIAPPKLILPVLVMLSAPPPAWLIAPRLRVAAVLDSVRFPLVTLLAVKELTRLASPSTMPPAAVAVSPNALMRAPPTCEIAPLALRLTLADALTGPLSTIAAGPPTVPRLLTLIVAPETVPRAMLALSRLALPTPSDSVTVTLAVPALMLAPAIAIVAAPASRLALSTPLAIVSLATRVTLPLSVVILAFNAIERPACRLSPAPAVLPTVGTVMSAPAFWVMSLLACKKSVVPLDRTPVIAAGVTVTVEVSN